MIRPQRTIPRLRMVAGPNGSGKSSLIPQLLEYVDLGVSVNADEIEADLKRQPGPVRILNLYDWRLQLTEADMLAFGELPDSQRLSAQVRAALQLQRNALLLHQNEIDSYLAAWIAEFLRHNLLLAQQTLTFETVMSHPSKLEFLREAQAAGYRTYLYFVATNDPSLNVARVRARVAAGGHPVSTSKIIDRYHRSLELAKVALKIVDRAYLFDNSGVAPQLVAEITNGREVVYQTDTIPAWVERVLS